MSLISNVLNQCRKPTGWFGRFVLWDMNRHHANVTDWGLQHLAIEQQDTILDVGCGGGRTVHKLAGMATEGKVYGIDVSQESVSVSRRINTRWIKLGRVEIRHGSVSCLPFAEHMFDLVTAVETHFFWPDLVADLHEVLRVLKPGGKLIIIAEVYSGGKYDKVLQKLAGWWNLVLYSASEYRDLFSKAGYAGIQIFEHYDKGWICAIGEKPSEVPKGEESTGRDDERGMK
jgi:ubiquinone/menaquinone biosynthesis C-methylase UbiE